MHVIADQETGEMKSSFGSFFFKFRFCFVLKIFSTPILIPHANEVSLGLTSYWGLHPYF